MNTIKVTALTAGKNDPSRRFRVCQFIKPLANHAVAISEYYPLLNKYTAAPIPQLGFVWTAGKLAARVPGIAAARGADITWLQRELIPGRVSFENFAGRKLLLDVDDAVWAGLQPDAIDRIADKCRGVIAGNQFLASHFRERGARTWVVPTCVDTERWKPALRKTTDQFVVGWTGTNSNLKYLYSIERALAEFLKQNTDARLLVISDKRPHFQQIPTRSWEFQPWNAADEVQQLQQIDVGLMPLADTEWERGKCACKMLLYMSVGIPTIATPVGMNSELFSLAKVGLTARHTDDWIDSLSTLFNDRQASVRFGAAARKAVEEKFSVNNFSAMLAGIFRQVAAEN